LSAGLITSNNLTGAGPNPYGQYDNGTPVDAPPYSTEGFPAYQNLPGDALYNSRGWWQVTITDPNSNEMTRGLVNFNGNGTINAIADGSGNIDIELNQIDWGNGSELQNLNIDISRFSQFSSDYNVIFSDQNGAELGLRTGVEIDREGYVSARFSNGASAKLYKLPLVTFSNPNGLNEVSGTAYSETELSGQENLREAGAGGAGFLEASTIESSNVDLADEFAKLIVSQRAFSAGTKIINTVDQMTEDLLRLR
jgi:flagellar hook protein FlgE